MNISQSFPQYGENCIIFKLSNYEKAPCIVNSGSRQKQEPQEGGMRTAEGITLLTHDANGIQCSVTPSQWMVMLRWLQGPFYSHWEHQGNCQSRHYECVREPHCPAERQGVDDWHFGKRRLQEHEVPPESETSHRLTSCGLFIPFKM